MTNNVRLSCQKIVACGAGSSKDWSNQTKRIHARKRGASKNNQLLLSASHPKGYEMVKVVGIHTDTTNGKVYGRVDNKCVRLEGYAYSMTAHGHTPGRWVYANRNHDVTEFLNSNQIRMSASK